MNNEIYEFKAIGRIKSLYKSKNGTPRQSSIVPESKGSIELNKTFFDKPYLSLVDLDRYSHIWVLFYFHENTNKKVRSKIKPPRLNGQSTGLFATRSPHRPNAIGLSLVKLIKIEANTIHVSGIDLLDETPILDIKPFIFEYDVPKSIGSDYTESGIKNNLKNYELILRNHENDKSMPNDLIKSEPDWINPNWIQSKGVIYEPQTTGTKFEVVNLNNKISIEELKDESQFEVLFTERSRKQLNLFHFKDSEQHDPECLIEDVNNEKNLYLNYRNKTLKELDQLKIDANEIAVQKEQPNKTGIDRSSNCSIKCRYCLEFIESSNEARNAIINTLIHDPRSTYRRTKCSDRLYYFVLDTMHITTYFDEDDKIIEIVKIKPNYL